MNPLSGYGSQYPGQYGQYPYGPLSSALGLGGYGSQYAMGGLQGYGRQYGMMPGYGSQYGLGGMTSMYGYPYGMSGIGMNGMYGMNQMTMGGNGMMGPMMGGMNGMNPMMSGYGSQYGAMPYGQMMPAQTGFGTTGVGMNGISGYGMNQIRPEYTSPYVSSQFGLNGLQGQYSIGGGYPGYGIGSQYGISPLGGYGSQYGNQYGIYPYGQMSPAYGLQGYGGSPYALGGIQGYGSPYGQLSGYGSQYGLGGLQGYGNQYSTLPYYGTNGLTGVYGLTGLQGGVSRSCSLLSGCGIGERCNTCGIRCEQQCYGPQKSCPLVNLCSNSLSATATGVCECLPGFARNMNGQCVAQLSCQAFWLLFFLVVKPFVFIPEWAEYSPGSKLQLTFMDPVFQWGEKFSVAGPMLIGIPLYCGIILFLYHKTPAQRTRELKLTAQHDQHDQLIITYWADIVWVMYNGANAIVYMVFHKDIRHQMVNYLKLRRSRKAKDSSHSTTSAQVHPIGTKCKRPSLIGVLKGQFA
ncbi:unnamed protein product, partial [Mesorhabditis spiculigera]